MGELEEKIVEPKHEDSPASNPTQCLAHLFASKEMVDLTIIIPGHNDNFKVHRLVLSMWSQVFQAMLFGPMAEGDTITLEEDPPEAFNWLLNYMYAGQTEFRSIELALQVYHLANKYLMRHLQSACSEYLINIVTAVSVPEILNIATLLEDEALINKCAEVLDKSADAFFTSPTIGSLNSDSLEQLLRKDLTVSSEAVIYQGIINWGRAHLKSKEKQVTPNTLRQEVNKFVPLIRFLTMTLEELVQHVLTDNILTLKEVEAIQISIAGISEANLPTLFSTNKEKRSGFHISKLNKCNVSHGDRITDFSLRKIANPDILVKIKTKDIIYLNKIEHKSDIGYKGTLTVKDSSGQEVQAAQFNGRVAEFDVPLKMLPEKTYTFNVSGGKSVDRYPDAYNIKENRLISGQMVNFIIDCVFHYWN